MSIVDKLLHAINLDEELGLFNLVVGQIEIPLVEALLDAAEGGPDLTHGLAIEVHGHLDFELLPEEEQVFPYLGHELIDDGVHVLHHVLPVDVFRDFSDVLAVQRPFRMHLADVLEFVVQVLVVQLQGAHCFDLAVAALVDAQGHHLLLVLEAAVLLHDGII